MLPRFQEIGVPQTALAKLEKEVWLREGEYWSSYT